MEISTNGLKLIARYEGFAPTPYNDPAGNCTVGYGELLHMGKCSLAELAREPLTPEQGWNQLREKVKAYVGYVNATGSYTQNEFDALVSFCYNLGPGGLRSLLDQIKSGVPATIAFGQYVHGSDGRVYGGLVSRRKTEAALYISTEEADMTPDEVNAIIDERFKKDVYPKIGAELATLGKHGEAIVVTANALIQHVATHPAGGPTATMVANLKDVQQRVGALEDEIDQFSANIKAIQDRGNGGESESTTSTPA